MQVNIYKGGRPIKEINDVNYIILQKDKSLEVATYNDGEWYYDTEDYDWFNVID